MPEHQPYPPKPWRRADRTADTLVLASWLASLLVAFVLLRPPEAPKTFQPEPVSIVATAVPAVSRAPQYFPWVRPGEAAPEKAGLRPWEPASKPRDGGFQTRFSNPLNDPVFNASNHGNENSFYGGDWVPENISARSGGAFLEVKREPRNGMPYTAAEMQTGGKYQYGRYEAVIQPASGSGLVTAFFTYTGPWFGDPHDEIDIEFLGADTTKIHFNYFRNGKSIKPASFDLPFDASARPHLYAFDWRPDGVTWYVDGVAYYATPENDPGVPVSAGKVMFSTWTGKPSMAGWHGKPVFRDGSGAQFNCVSFTPMGHDTASCSDTYGIAGAGASSGAR